MGGYAFFVWLAVVMTVIRWWFWSCTSVMQHRAILRGVAQQRAREAFIAAQQQEARTNICRKTACGLPVLCWRAGADYRPWCVCAALEYRSLYAGEILYGKRETQQMPEVGQRLRVGGMVMPVACSAIRIR